MVKKQELVVIPSHRRTVDGKRVLDKERAKYNWSMSKLISVIVDLQIKNGFRDIKAEYGEGRKEVV